MSPGAGCSSGWYLVVVGHVCASSQHVRRHNKCATHTQTHAQARTHTRAHARQYYSCSSFSRLFVLVCWFLERAHARTHTHMHARTHAHTHAHTYARTHTRTHARTARTHARRRTDTYRPSCRIPRADAYRHADGRRNARTPQSTHTHATHTTLTHTLSHSHRIAPRCQVRRLPRPGLHLVEVVAVEKLHAGCVVKPILLSFTHSCTTEWNSVMPKQRDTQRQCSSSSSSATAATTTTTTAWRAECALLPTTVKPTPATLFHPVVVATHTHAEHRAPSRTSP